MAYTNYSGNNYNNNNGGYKKSGGKFQSDNVTTTGFSLDNVRAGKFLNFSYWGKSTVIEIGTCPSNVPITWDMRKSANKISQMINFNCLNDLCDICEEVMDKLKTTGNFTPVAVEAGSKNDCMVELSNGSNINMPVGIYLVLYKGVDTNNKTNIMDVYPFTSTKRYRNYNHTTGERQDDISKLGEFRKFYRGIQEATKAFTMAQAHTVAEVKKSDKLATFTALSSIGAALGVNFANTMKEKSTSGNNTYSSNNTYSKPAPNMNPYASMQGIGNGITDEPVDINLDMAGLTNVDMSQFK